MSPETRNDPLLLTIHSDHAERIYAGSKTAELRKSFSQDSAPLVFLYETAPVSAVTGAFVISKREKYEIGEAVKLASTKGVTRKRARAYFQKRNKGWVIEVGFAVQFRVPIPANRISTINHYFKPPQAFAYLARYEGLTNVLLRAFLENIEGNLRIRKSKKTKFLQLQEMILEEVGQHYEDIDSDFVDQTINPAIGAQAAFSTDAKDVFEIFLGSIHLGYTVLSFKTFGAVKTGPTILFPEYRGIGIGTTVRKAIVAHLNRKRVRKIYCTCPAFKKNIVSYLINSGMSIEARLRSHLRESGDELVFGLRLRNPDAYLPITSQRKPVETVKGDIKIVRIGSSEPLTNRAMRFFRKYSKDWYFEIPEDNVSRITAGLENLDSGCITYSAKPRYLFAAIRGKSAVRSVAIVTMKRSNMIKLNLVSMFDDFVVIRDLVAVVLKGINFRRAYCTLPSRASQAGLALVANGFRFEGVLDDPFGNGNHVCFGYLKGE